MSELSLLSEVNRTSRLRPPTSELDPGRVKMFFILQNYTQPGVIHVDATI